MEYRGLASGPCNHEANNAFGHGLHSGLVKLGCTEEGSDRLKFLAASLRNPISPKRLRI